MTSELIISTILISLALIFYSIGVWSERIAGRLKAWHLLFFWGGLGFDTTGTGIMFGMAGGMGTDIHSVTRVGCYYSYACPRNLGYRCAPA